jgi:polysaccharide biosynthesis/export protein
MTGRNHSFLLRSLYVFLVSSCSFFLQAQNPATPQPAPTDPANAIKSPQSPSAQPTNSNAKLGVGDLIEMTVFGVPELSVKTRISMSGDVYLPLIAYVHVADLTVDEAQGLIQKRLEDGEFVRDPHVSIFVDESASQSVTIIGEVGHPGQFSAIGDRRLFDMISAAGGLTEKAGRNVTIERRGDPNQTIVVQLSSNLADDTKDNVVIEPGDTIIVSLAGIIYVVGDVNRPSGFRIEDQSFTVLKALALAGGNTKTSSLGKTRILRPTSNGVQEIPVDLKKVLYNKAPDVAMVKGDILFVPGSAAKAAAYRTVDAAVALSTAVAIVALQ